MTPGQQLQKMLDDVAYLLRSEDYRDHDRAGKVFAFDIHHAEWSEYSNLCDVLRYYRDPQIKTLVEVLHAMVELTELFQGMDYLFRAYEDEYK